MKTFDRGKMKYALSEMWIIVFKSPTYSWLKQCHDCHPARNFKNGFIITVSHGNSNSNLCLSSASQPTEIFRTRTPTTTAPWAGWPGRTSSVFSPGGSGSCQGCLRHPGAWGGWQPTFSLGPQASSVAQHSMSPLHRPLFPLSCPFPSRSQSEG